MKCLRFFVTGLLLCCVASPSIAAGKGKSKLAKKSPATIEVPFNSDIETASNPTVNNLAAIFIALSKNYPKYIKNEFETNEAYQDRLVSLETAKLTGKLKYNDTVAFPLLTSFESSYDADSQTMSVSIPMASILDSDLSNSISYELPPGKGQYSYSSETVYGGAIEVYSTLTETKKFTGTNAFGRKVKITGKLYDTFSVAVRGDNNLLKSYDNITLKVSIPPDKARVAKTTGDILLVGNLIHPYVGTGTNHSSATIDNPVEFLDRIRYVSMELTGIWYYSRKTGEIYLKQDISYPDDLGDDE